MQQPILLFCIPCLLGIAHPSGAADDTPLAVEEALRAADPDIEELRKKADSGDIESMVAIGEYFVTLGAYYNDAVNPDYEETLRLLHKAADARDSSAMYWIGGMYTKGFGVEQDYEVAMEWYNKAADAGNPAALASIGWLHYHGFGVKQDVDEAARWYRRAAEKGSHEGMNNLGHMYQHGIGVEQDLQQAIHCFKKSATAGNPFAYDNLGDIYLKGEGVPPDVETAKAMFVEAAKLGMLDSIIRLGRLERATDTSDGKTLAFQWFRLAQGHIEGMREIGECYFDGVGVEPDPAEALRWYRRAIEAGNQDAVVELAKRYLSGDGVDADPKKAMKMLETAAAKGNAPAHTKLGHIASDAKDYEKAQQHYLAAAELGDTMAMLSLFISFREGFGVSRDETQAMSWLKKSADHGNPIARQILANMNQ